MTEKLVVFAVSVVVSTAICYGAMLLFGHVLDWLARRRAAKLPPGDPEE
jgi:hypothetical protein